MKSNRALQKLKLLQARLLTMIKASPKQVTDRQSDMPHERLEFAFDKPQSLAYRIVGDRAARLLPLYEGLDMNLLRAGVKIGFKAYVSLTVFVTIFVSLVAFGVTPFLLFSVFRVPLIPAVLFGIGAGLFATAFSTVGFYAYPIYRADKLRRALEDELPFTTGYMSILTSAGVSPEKIFHSLSNLSVPLAVTAEAKDVVRDVNLFGRDIISTLQEMSKRTPSERFREMLEGFISTIHSGGNASAYLRQKSREYMKLKRINLKKFSDTLSALSEFYVALLLTGPLLFVIILSVMAMLGGGNLGLLSPDFLLNLLTYLGIPLGAIVFLIILDAVTPKW